MPNGKPGDNPFTDIINHGTNVFGGGVDELVREIVDCSPRTSWQTIADLLWEFDTFGETKPDLTALRVRLEALRPRRLN